MSDFFSKRLLTWYEEHKRDLPWRATHDPYRIWISEVILQQTRVAQGEAYYRRFVERFPDVTQLAAAEEDEVLKLWQGLGYYSRARNLHAAAKSIVAAGGFPTTYEGVRGLKGVGNYTAAAICSFAYGLPYAAVDGNVYRVLARWLGIETPIDSTAGVKLFAETAQQLLDREQPGLYNQAIMEFGALLCTPASPDCLHCPLADSCVALREDKVEALPVKQHKTKVTERYFNYLYVKAGPYTYINKRSGSDIWKNLYELPLVETGCNLSEEAFYANEQTQALFAPGEQPQFRCLKRGVRHVLSHRVITANFYEVVLPEETASMAAFQRIRAEELGSYAVPRLIHQFLQQEQLID